MLAGIEALHSRMSSLWIVFWLDDRTCHWDVSAGVVHMFSGRYYSSDMTHTDQCWPVAASDLGRSLFKQSSQICLTTGVDSVRFPRGTLVCEAGLGFWGHRPQPADKGWTISRELRPGWLNIRFKGVVARLVSKRSVAPSGRGGGWVLNNPQSVSGVKGRGKHPRVASSTKDPAGSCGLRRILQYP